MITPYVAELAVYEPRAPIVFFGAIALLARQDLVQIRISKDTEQQVFILFWRFVCSFLVTFLPETANQKLPDTLAEGEEAGKGDNLYVAIKKSCSKPREA